MNVESKNDWERLLNTAASGDTLAMNKVAFWYRNGLTINGDEIVSIDNMLAFSWTKKSYELGNIIATEEYANYLTDKENGVCEPNIELGIELYKKCLENGSETAAYSLGLEYRNKKLFNKAFEYYKIAENSSEYNTGLTFALCYYYGVGVDKDKKKALDFFLSINEDFYCQYDVNEANYLIGMIYLEGDVVEKDIEKARYYLELADSDSDHRSAQEILILIGRTKYQN